MDNSSVYQERPFHNLTARKPKMHLLDEPNGFVSAVAKNSLGHQMRYTVEELERELALEGRPHVLQLVCEGDSCEPDRWELFADGQCVADGDGDYARACFERSADDFLETLSDAVCFARLKRLTDDEYQLLTAARRIASIEKKVRA